MSEPNKTVIRGIGEVFTSADAFADFDKVEASRLSDRPAPRDSAALDDDAVVPISKGWSKIPSIRDQHLKMPDTVKHGAPTTLPLNLSVPEDLETLNELQAKANDEKGPSVAISEMDRKFYEGSWYVYLTFSEILYQKL